MFDDREEFYNPREDPLEGTLERRQGSASSRLVRMDDIIVTSDTVSNHHHGGSGREEEESVAPFTPMSHGRLGRWNATNPSVAGQGPHSTTNTANARREHSDEATTSNGVVSPDQDNHLVVTSTHPSAVRDERVGSNGDGMMADYEHDAQIQSLFLEELGEQSPTREGDLLDAVQRRVDHTIAQLDAGAEYEQSPLTEAIIRKHLATAKVPLSPGGGITDVSPIRHGTLLADDQLGDIILTPEQRKMLVDAGILPDLLPPFFIHPSDWYPASQLRFDDDGIDDGAGHRTRGAASPTDTTFDRPPSVNAPGGIRPYRPPPTDTATEMQGDTSVVSMIGVEGPPPPCQRSSSLQVSLSRARALLWQGYRTGKPFGLYCLLIPLIYCGIVATLFQFVGGAVGGGPCDLSVGKEFEYMFTYGLAIRVLPTAVFFSYLLHIMVYAHVKATLAATTAERGDSTATHSARVVRALTAQKKALLQVKKSASSSTGREEFDKVDREVAMHTLLQTQQPGDASSVPWDVPSFAFCIRQKSFLALVLGIVVTLSFTQLADFAGFAALSLVPIEASAVFIPTMACAFAMRLPQIVWPVVLLEAIPFIGVYVAPRITLSYDVFHPLWPFAVTVAERIFFYTFRAVALPSLPVGARVAATTMIGFSAHVLIMSMSTFISTNFVHPILAVCLQVFFYELLLGTVVLDRMWMFAKAHFLLWYKNIKPRAESMDATDFRCISTQTRWVSQVMAAVSIIPIRFFNRWPRYVEGGFECNTGLLVIEEVYPASLGAVIGSYAIAALVTGLIRKMNGCLLPPLMIRGKGFPLTMGIYLFVTTALAMTGNVHGQHP